MKVVRKAAIVNPPTPRWSVMLEWTGNKFEQLPLIEYIVKRDSDASGTFLPMMMADASWWDLDRGKARRIYSALVRLFSGRRISPYFRVGLFRDKRNVTRYARGRVPKMPKRRRAA